MYEKTTNGECFFNGLEERLCRWFYFDRLRREDWPDLTDDQFMRMAQKEIKLARSFVAYFMDENPHPYDILRYCVPEWHDAMVLAYDDFPQLSTLVRWVKDILENPGEYNELKVQMAEEVKEVINAADLPDAAKQRFTELKKEHNCNF